MTDAEKAKAAEELIEVNGVHLCVKQAGTNIGKSHTMIFVHGLGFSKENMDPLFNYYKDLHHVVSYDVRGHGRSDKPEAWTLADDVEDLHALINALGIEKPVIVGFSMGSYITLATAEEYPDLCDRIVLIGTKGGGSSSIQAITAQGKPGSGAASVRQRVFSPTNTAEQIEAFTASIASPVHLTHEQHAAIYRSLEGFDNLSNASKVSIPVLCLSGQHDGVNPPAKGKIVADTVARGRFYEVNGAGHITFFENFPYTVHRIDEFLQDA
ncbi:alpha/beta fold hydrolase [Anaerotardibacter muris]|uniref:alpha/beta fold hydrolase n=1 Tax=Anaerotardibacter muris TaxID=2941505 RepID=UPI00203C3A60|nr:alpha/beta hydrolase [Anaerotardibacter muris]